MRDLKYMIAYIMPLSALLALLFQGAWSYSTVIFAFGIIPVLEPLLPRSERNLSSKEREEKLKKRLFDWLLYLNLPILYGIIAFFLYVLSTQSLAGFEITGLVLSVGIVIGACGINVGHELGHRSHPNEQTVAKLLLLPAMYMHFFIEHNRGHHKNVATPLDPATARYGESLYFFWLRSAIGSYISAWRLESKRLDQQGHSFWSIHNEMILFQVAQLSYLTAIWIVFSFNIMLLALLAGVTGFLLLESINYIEHYGLQRQVLPNGRYERVQPKHSWNANFELGRIILYELTRHSDHHYLANKKYQILDHHDESPQLPMGYPSSMLLAMAPPLWFYVMNKRVRNRNIEAVE